MIMINITDGQRKRANELYEFNVLNNSVTRGEGNKAGAIGEIMVMDRFAKDSTYAGDYDYDLIIKDKKVDVKTKRCDYRPEAHHQANILAFNTTQKCDYYCFVYVNYRYTIGWIIGWKKKDEFFKEATFKKKGEVDDYNTNFTFRDDCYTMVITDLDLYNKETTK